MNIDEKINLLGDNDELDVWDECCHTENFLKGKDLKVLVHNKNVLESQIRLIKHQLDNYSDITSTRWIQHMLDSALHEVRNHEDFK